MRRGVIPVWGGDGWVEGFALRDEGRRQPEPGVERERTMRKPTLEHKSKEGQYEHE